MNNFDDILDVKAETPAEPPKDTRPQWQVKQQQNRETAYQITDAAIEEFLEAAETAGLSMIQDSYKEQWADYCEQYWY